MGTNFSIPVGMTRKKVLRMAKDAGLSNEDVKQIKNFMKSDKTDNKISNDVEQMALMALLNRQLPYDKSPCSIISQTLYPDIVRPFIPADATMDSVIIMRSDGFYQKQLPSGSVVNANNNSGRSSILHINADGSYSQLSDSDGDGKVDAYLEVDSNNKEIRRINYNN